MQVGVLPCFIGDADPLVRVLPAHAIRRSFWLVTHRDTRNPNASGSSPIGWQAS
jgi:hypothetical protein